MKIQKTNYQNQNMNFKGAVRISDNAIGQVFSAKFLQDMSDAFVKLDESRDIAVNFLNKNFEKLVMKKLKQEEIPFLHLNKPSVAEDEFEKFVQADWDGKTAVIQEV